jgi:hypothetical protein
LSLTYAGPVTLTGPETAALAETVAALRRELDGVRQSARTRAVIEQAKGMLVERHGITLEEAFGRLRALSQQNNVRLVEVAATLVGVAIPDAEEDAGVTGERLAELIPASPAASPAWAQLREQPDVKAGTMSVLLDSVTGATSAGDEAARLVLDLLADQGVEAVVLFRAAADGSLRFVGQTGFAGDVISAWRSIPPTTDVPFVRSVRRREPLFMGDRASRVLQFPALAEVRSAWEATASIPIDDQGEVVGVVGLAWRAEQRFDADRQRQLCDAAGRVSRLLLRHVAAVDADLEWLRAVLAVNLDPWVLLEPVPGGAGVQDFVVRAVAPQVDGGADWPGHRMFELWPDLVHDETSSSLSALAQAGGAWTTTVVSAGPWPWGQAGARLRGVSVGPRVVLVWRPGHP